MDNTDPRNHSCTPQFQKGWERKKSGRALYKCASDGIQFKNETGLNSPRLDEAHNIFIEDELEVKEKESKLLDHKWNRIGFQFFLHNILIRLPFGIYFWFSVEMFDFFCLPWENWADKPKYEHGVCVWHSGKTETRSTPIDAWNNLSLSSQQSLRSVATKKENRLTKNFWTGTVMPNRNDLWTWSWLDWKSHS